MVGAFLFDSTWYLGLTVYITFVLFLFLFLGLNGEDVIEDVRHKFVEKPPGKQPRSYLFRVEYHDKDSDTGENLKVGEGQVLLLFPRHPAAGRKYSSSVKFFTLNNVIL